MTDPCPEERGVPTPQGRVVTAPGTFESRDPATGELVGTFPIHGSAEVDAAVARARSATGWWRALGFEGRKQRLLAFRARIARHASEIAELIRSENGKPAADGFIELLMACDHLGYAARRARRVLGPRRARGSLLSANQVGRIVHEPFGVVGILTPWNYPLVIPVSDIASALGAGNTVVLKPSEFAPAVASWVVERFREVVWERPVLQLVTGFGDTGAALCAADVDRIAFTGSAQVGRAVARACAERLIPVSLELGGKDALVVDADADLDAAAEAAVFGAFWNAGQSCVSIERAYVVDAVHDAFVAKVAERARAVRPGSQPGASYGPMTTPAQLDIVRRHINDALERGARAVVGGAEAVRPPYIDPVVLTDVPPDALIMQEETFGPTLPIVRVRDAAEALSRANDSPFGLSASVFGHRRARELAARVRAGAVAVNSTMSFYAHPGLPFGGVGESGSGRVHGDDGLRSFARPRALSRPRFGLGAYAPDRLQRHRRVDAALRRLPRLLYGRGAGR